MKGQLEQSLSSVKNFYDSNEISQNSDDMIFKLWLFPETADDNSNIPQNDIYIRMWDKDNVQNFENKPLINSDESGMFKGIIIPSADDILAKALYCDLNDYTESDYFLLQKFQDNEGGYGDTHFLIGILLIDSLSCLDRNVFVKNKNEAISRILKAQKQDKVFSDLYVERIVVLYWAGLKGEIKASWIQLIIENQEENGNWQENNKFRDSIFHITGLSALSLRYFQNNELGNIWFSSR